MREWVIMRVVCVHVCVHACMCACMHVGGRHVHRYVGGRHVHRYIGGWHVHRYVGGRHVHGGSEKSSEWVSGSKCVCAVYLNLHNTKEHDFFSPWQPFGSLKAGCILPILSTLPVLPVLPVLSALPVLPVLPVLSVQRIG